MEEVKWMRKASKVEVIMNQLSQAAKFLVVYKMSFCARRPLQPREVERALSHLYRKTPNLRVRLAEKGGELCFIELDKETIHFEVSATEVEEVIDFLHSHTFPKEGPLWQARLVPVLTPRYHPQHLSSFHDDLQDAFPYCYHLLFGFSHAIGDGHTFKKICAAFVHILDRVMSGEKVDGEQIGSFCLNEAYNRKAHECITMFSRDEAWREECLREANEGKPESSLLPHLLSFCEDHPKKTVLYTQTLDQMATTRLHEKCRAAKVTLSSCMAAAGNLALVDMLVEKGVVQDTYSISNSHMINMRRTWPKGTAEHVFGCYIASFCRQFLETPRAAEEDQFWQYVRDIHSKFYGLLHDSQFMQKVMLTLWCHITNNTEYLGCDITYNNRGDLTQEYEDTKEVTVTNLLSSSSIQNTDIPWDLHFGTMRGRLSHTIKYNTGLVSEATALKFGDLVYAHLLKAAAP